MQMKYFYKRIVDGKIVQLNAHPTRLKFVEPDTVEITKVEYDTLFAETKKHGEDVRTYTEQVRTGEITLEDVPEDCRAEVEAIINQPEPPNNSYGVDNETYNAIIDEYTLDLMESGVL